ncbi:MAG: hypothetical protein ACR2HF_16205 [Methylococcaceae bacterium]
MQGQTKRDDPRTEIAQTIELDFWRSRQGELGELIFDGGDTGYRSGSGS